MNDDRIPPLDEHQRAAHVAVRSLGPVQAAPEFMARMRTEFVDGAPERIATPGFARRLGSRPRRRVWLAGLAAAAAVVLLVSSIGGLDVRWKLLSIDGARAVVLDGQRVSCADLSPIQAALHPGCRIELPAGARMELLAERSLYVQVEGGVTLTVPRRTRLLQRRELVSEFEGEGTLRIATGAQFAGNTYRLRTPLADFSARGTAFAVTQSFDRMSVSVLEGEVRARVADGTTRVMSAGERWSFGRSEEPQIEGVLEEIDRNELARLLGHLSEI